MSENMQHRWQVQRWDGEHEGDWVDAEPPVDKKVLDLAAQIIELEQRVKYEEDERGKFMDKAWAATGAKGDYPYGGVILMEIEGQAKERRLLIEALKEISTYSDGSLKESDWTTLEGVQEVAKKALAQCLNVEA